MNKSEKKLIEEFDKIIKNIKNDIKEICEQGGVPALLWIDDVEYLESFILKALAQQKQEILEFIKDQKKKHYSDDLIIKHLIDGIKAEELCPKKPKK